ncbi:ATP-dependent DNA helicase RecG [Rhizobacter sp. Root404]|uniref:ATP-dependent DNA helicase RecG n=1 Tax=Rhizobacter sp. Root404 TaxID=1736528 RepID=UPI0007013DF0|nr:ATP-dependent DNA helicase RecG [Rhizobacter sp. Root404]KQW35523.1 ATP-dependent DNA helicase RecG [Rhizobacter sp. Root404]
MPAVTASPAAKDKSGPQRALEKLGLVRPIDFALHLPMRYEDETRLVSIASLRDGSVGQVEGVVASCEVQIRGRRQLVARLHDGSDDLVLRFLHFYPSHQKALAVGTRVRVRGEARGGFFGLEMVHPTFKAVTEGAPLATALTPVYPTSAQLPQAYLRKAMDANLARVDLSELLPPEAVPAGMMNLREALMFLHHPAPNVGLATLEDRSHPAWQRLKFEELLAQQLSQLQAKRERELQRAPPFRVRNGGLQEQLLAALPFALTKAQRRVVDEIAHDLQRAVPMHRLLQGDVGSGKTVVAAVAAAVAIHDGWQCALMAPTEILAEQHLRKLVGWLEPLGITVAWLTGSRKGKGRAAMLAQVASGEAMLVVGTHAVIQEQVQFAKLGLAIIDEQHRFGVQQRLALREKLRSNQIEPHTLMMSATPIPRTLAMTLFADLDVSTIDELPPGRTPVVTKLFADDKREAVIGRIRDAVAQGQQVYWVCPLIEESETLDLQNATETHAHLSAALPERMVGLLHGRMKATEKAAVMALFTAGEMAVLVSTTVIEVGVDVPNASLMVIEHAERFGLSQLHQLRGRVGRGTVASVCVLLYTAPLSDTGKARLKAMLETGDGFEIARRDLDIRGPGEFMGARQSGAPLLRFADLAEDEALVHLARDAATLLLDRHPEVALAHVNRWLGGRSDYLKA